MAYIKNQFSISDLENLSGIKAHTIRIWEKRYNLLEPNRTDTNIRTYSADSLRKLLNVVLLQDHGLKISKIAQLNAQQFREATDRVVRENFNSNYYLNEMILSMMEFDRNHFNEIYHRLSAEQSFEFIFENYFIPLLKQIGLLWQSTTISPANEHFISQLIKEKMLLQMAQLSSDNCASDDHTKYVLFMPEGEIHDLGVNYIYYHLLKKKAHVIYLGVSVPIESLVDFVGTSAVVFVSSFTVSPEDYMSYCESFDTHVLQKGNAQLKVYGRQLDQGNSLWASIHFYDKSTDLIASL